jgi:hypothetical protein
MTLDTTQQLGWAWEASEGSDPINATNALYWHFGIRTTDLKDKHPTKEQHWSPVYKVNTRNPSDMDNFKNTTAGRYGFYPTNAIPLHMIMGNVSLNTPSAGINTFNNLNTGSLKTFTVRSESTGGTVDKFISSQGCKATSVSGFINLLSEHKFLSEIMTYNGLTTIASTALSEVHTTGVKHATDDYTMTGTERDERYRYDTNTLFSWNSNDIIVDLGMFKYDIINLHTIKHIDGQAATKYIDEGNYVYTVSFSLWRGNTNTDAVWTDYLAGTQRNVVFTIYNGSTYYRTYTFSNVSLGTMDADYSMGEDNALWHCHGIAEDLSIVAKDGVSTSFFPE